MMTDNSRWETAGSVLSALTYFLACPLLALLLGMVSEGW